MDDGPSIAAREQEIVDAYMAGRTVPDILAEFDLAPETLTWILHHSGKVPLRRRRRTGNDEVDALLAGLNQLIEYQGQRIAELEAELERCKNLNAADPV